MEQTLVSIITPMYNAERYIAQTIESVQQQTYSNWEMIIMDDVSTDNSAVIVQNMAVHDPRIRYFCEEKKSYVAKTRNDAMKQARGRYLAFLDSDDLWVPEKLECQLSLMEGKNTAFCYGACEVIDEEGWRSGKIRHVPEFITYEKLLWGNVIPCLTVLLDREQTGEIEMPDMGHEDYATWLSILKRVKNGYGTDRVLGYYRVNRNSVSGHKLKTIRWTWKIYRKTQGLPAIKSLCYLMGHLTQAVRKM